MTSRKVLGSLILLALVAGCSSSPSEPQRAKTPAVPPATEQVKGLVLPFDAYELSSSEIYIVESAEDILVRDCMRKKNMEWKLLPIPSSDSLDPDNRRRYGVMEPKIASRFGYHVPPDSSDLTRRQNAWKERERLPVREQLASFGKDGNSGCWGKAHEHLLRDVPEVGNPTLNDLRSKEFSATLRHPEVKRAFGAWRKCMKVSGFSYRDPLSVTEDRKWSKTNRPSREELAVAKADVRCKGSADVVDVWRKVDTALQRKAIRSHTVQFDKMKTANKRHLEAARRVLER